MLKTIESKEKRLYFRQNQMLDDEKELNLITKQELPIVWTVGFPHTTLLHHTTRSIICTKSSLEADLFEQLAKPNVIRMGQQWPTV